MYPFRTVTLLNSNCYNDTLINKSYELSVRFCYLIIAHIFNYLIIFLLTFVLIRIPKFFMKHSHNWVESSRSHIDTLASLYFVEILI